MALIGVHFASAAKRDLQTAREISKEDGVLLANLMWAKSSLAKKYVDMKAYAEYLETKLKESGLEDEKDY